MAAEHITAEELQDLAAILTVQQEKVEHGLTTLEEDTAFHYGIARATRNTVLLRVLDTIMDLLRESRERSLQQADRPVYSLAGHRRILEALVRGDRMAARTESLRHLQEIEERVFRVEEEDEEDLSS
jgi:GntR family transcriptional repressor for pyruvate dehydrogenase complex